MKSGRVVCTIGVLALVALCASQVIAQNPKNPGIFKDYSAPVSSTLRFWASDAGKNVLLHSPSPAALPLLQKFHPEAAGLYPQLPLNQPAPRPVPVPGTTITGCGTSSGTVMNLEPANGAVSQTQPQVDFFLNELGTDKDLVVETAFDARGETGVFDSFAAEYVHRDASQSCFGGTDFEMGNPAIPDPLVQGSSMFDIGNARILADPNPAHKQIILADLRQDATTSGVGLRRIPIANLKSTSTCPMGTLNPVQEATCTGNSAIIVNGSEDDVTDAVSIAQDPRTSGIGAGDIYVINSSQRVLRDVIVLTACKANFATTADCSTPLIISGSFRVVTFPSIAVLPGGANAGYLVMSFVSEDGLQYVSCTPKGAPAHPVCISPRLINDTDSFLDSITNNPGLFLTSWPVISVRANASGQTTYVVWGDCKSGTEGFPLSGCPDADIGMSYASSLTSPSWTFTHVRASAGHQLFPGIAYDTGQNILNIAYFDTNSNLYKNNVIVGMNQIASGTNTVGSTTYLTTAYDSLEGDGTEFAPTLGDYIGIAAHGGTGVGSSRVYVAFPNNARRGTYSGGATNTQSDNNITRATY